MVRARHQGANVVLQERVLSGVEGLEDLFQVLHGDAFLYAVGRQVGIAVAPPAPFGNRWADPNLRTVALWRTLVVSCARARDSPIPVG